MKTDITIISKRRTVLHCCLIMLLISFLVSVTGRVDIRQFISNLMHTESFF